MNPGTLIGVLMDEHLEIESMLKVVDQMIRREENVMSVPDEHWLQALGYMSGMIEEIHHGKEESLLFPALDATGIVNQGGPKCDLFFGYHMKWSEADRITEAAKKEDLPTPGLRESSKAFVARNSPLKIPISEHMAGRTAVDILRSELRRSRKTRDTGKFLKVAKDYVSLLRIHIRKENECLFVMANQRIPEDEQVRLLATLDTAREDRKLRMMKSVRELLEGVYSTGPVEKQVVDALREVIDPELGTNIVDLGLIHECRIISDKIEIDMILTTLTCPLGDFMAREASQKVEAAVGAGWRVRVKVLKAPLWSRDRISKDVNFATKGKKADDCDSK